MLLNFNTIFKISGGMSGLQSMMRQFQQGAAGKFGNMFGGMGGEK